MKLALFDFCDTLTNFQTADCYVDYTLRLFSREKKYNVIANNILFSDFLNKHWKIKKKIHLCFLRGLTKEELQKSAEEYYLKYIVPNSFKCMKEMIGFYKSKEYKVYIVSGGYSIYINEYAKECGIDGVIANEFKYKRRNNKDIFTGNLMQKDCMGIEKIKRLNRFFADKEIEDSVSFSDSDSDIPFLNWTKKGVVVSKYKKRKFALENGFEQIVISNMGKEKMEFETPYI